jgi:hypothetical protein
MIETIDSEIFKEVEPMVLLKFKEPPNTDKNL